MDQSDPFHLFPYRAIVDHPPLAWPNGAKVAVWVIPNIEHFHWEIGSGARTCAIIRVATTAIAWAFGA